MQFNYDFHYRPAWRSGARVVFIVTAIVFILVAVLRAVEVYHVYPRIAPDLIEIQDKL